MIQATEEKEAAQQGVTGGREENTEAVIQASEKKEVAQERSKCEQGAGNTHRMMSCGKKAQRNNVSEGWGWNALCGTTQGNEVSAHHGERCGMGAGGTHWRVS